MNTERLAALGAALQARAQWLAVAESCTGGLLAARLTDVPGASGWFDRGLVTYANRAKVALLGVPATLIETHGAVSAEVAQAMARGLRAGAGVDWTIAVTGVAGPGGGTAAKPVGTVWVAWEGPAVSEVRLLRLQGDRDAIRQQTVVQALQGLHDYVTL